MRNWEREPSETLRWILIGAVVLVWVAAIAMSAVALLGTAQPATARSQPPTAVADSALPVTPEPSRADGSEARSVAGEKLTAAGVLPGELPSDLEHGKPLPTAPSHSTTTAHGLPSTPTQSVPEPAMTIPQPSPFASLPTVPPVPAPTPTPSLLPVSSVPPLAVPTPTPSLVPLPSVPPLPVPTPTPSPIPVPSLPPSPVPTPEPSPPPLPSPG